MSARRGWARGGAVASGVWLLLACTTACDEGSGDREVDQPKVAPALEATNWDDTEFSLSEHRGNVVLLFFGYTYCPDICPTTLASVRRAYEDLDAAESEQVDVVFVSVDPERDTLEKLSKYVPHFHEDFYGLRLEGKALSETMEGYGVVSAQREVEAKGAGDYYAVDHTGTIFVIDPEGRIRYKLPPSAQVEQIVGYTRRLLEETRS